jgi:hypothetical protein
LATASEYEKTGTMPGMRFALTPRWIRTAGPGCFGRKRPLPAGFSSPSAPIGVPEADRRTTGF